jgi:hypothetical protein
MQVDVLPSDGFGCVLLMVSSIGLVVNIHNKRKKWSSMNRKRSLGIFLVEVKQMLRQATTLAVTLS